MITERVMFNGQPPRDVMNIRQAAEYLGLSPDTLYNYAGQGLLPAFKFGNRWRFRRPLLDEWMDKQAYAGVVREARP